MVHGLPGKFIVVDGIDGAGKGVVAEAIVDYLVAENKKVLDLVGYWKHHHRHPQFEINHFGGPKNKNYLRFDYIDPKHFDAVISEEPTHCHVGATIRYNVLDITNEGRYSALQTAQYFAADRLELYKQVLLPALTAGKIVVQSRSVSTSLVYQPLQAQRNKQELTIEQILNMEGNVFALENAPDLLILARVDQRVAEERLKGRRKDDATFMEESEFQKKVAAVYNGELLQGIFESRGTRVAYLDCGGSIDQTKERAIEIAQSILKI